MSDHWLYESWPREGLRLHTQTWGVRKARAGVMPEGRCRKIGAELCSAALQVQEGGGSSKEEGATYSVRCC